MSAINRKRSVDEVRRHASAESCWIVVEGQVWDVTEFAAEHPGGAEKLNLVTGETTLVSASSCAHTQQAILEHAGRDASSAYNAVHPPSLLPKNLPQSALLGTLDTATIDAEWAKPPPTATGGGGAAPALDQDKPPLETILNAFDFETVAKKTLTPKTWAFYSSGATDCLTRDANHAAFAKIWFRPRVLANVERADTSGRILGTAVSLPLFVSPAALARMVHREGEKGIARAARRKGILQAISTNASFPVDEICPAAPGQPFIFQLYVDRKRANTEALLRKVKAMGCFRAIMLTVDAPVIGKREADERVRADASLRTGMSNMSAKNDGKGGGVGRTTGSYIDPKLSWDDLAWLKRQTDLPIIVKGVQSAADAQLCVKYGVQGIVCSNHGGRELDSAPAAIMVLLELQKCCPEVFEHLEVYVDGGIRRGTDILKCLCLGATACGIGRHFLYALNYGQEGVEHFIDILKDELETAMRLCGITDLSQVHPGLLNTLELDRLVPSTVGHPYAKWRPKRKTSRL